MATYTKTDCYLKMVHLERALKVHGIEVPHMTLRFGSRTNGVTNTLIVNKTNVWQNGVAGMTPTDAHRALSSTIALLSALES